MFAALHELASASSRTLLKLTSSVRVLLKPYGDTLNLLELPRHNANTSFLSSFYRKVELLDSEDGFASFVVAPPLKNASALTGRRQHSNNLQKKHYSDNSQ